MTARFPSRSGHRRWLGAALVAVSAAGCSDPAPAPPSTAPEAPLLTFDGITITFGETTPYVDYLASFAPEWGRKTRLRAVLEDFLVPLRLGQRAFATERAEALAKAKALRSIADNVAELDRKSQLLSRRRKVLARRQVDLPASMFLFDPLTTGAVSDPIETPRGWFLVACFDLRESALKVDDLSDALEVAFTTHDVGTWTTWFEGEKKRLADKVTFVHPDFRDAMPAWMQLP